MTSVGSFLKEKLGNMAKWVTEEVGKENLEMDLELFVANRSEFEVTLIAQTAGAKHMTIVAHRDWCGLNKLLNADDVPAHISKVLVELLHVVKQREHMHDKFWRYMELFRDVVNSNGEDVANDEQGST